jgi:hypothetical protein
MSIDAAKVAAAFWVLSTYGKWSEIGIAVASQGSRAVSKNTRETSDEIQG